MELKEASLASVCMLSYFVVRLVAGVLALLVLHDSLLDDGILLGLLSLSSSFFVHYLAEKSLCLRLTADKSSTVL